MKLGAFSISLSVQDLEASKSFYEKLGFEAAGGNPDHGWLILRNGATTIGIFNGMFEGNLLTFNPGWAQDATPLPEFTDVRDIQRSLREQGVAVLDEADENTEGPASFIVVDPDGNRILIDQHV